MQTLKISLLVFILSITISAQWFPLNSFTSNDLYMVIFVNDSVGFIRDTYKIYKTTDGGNFWSLVASQSTSYFYDIFFLNENMGWYTCQSSQSYEGSIYKTSDGGITWNLQMTTGSEVGIGRIQFVDALNGWCIGIWSMGPCLLYKTTNGGLTWSTIQPEINLPFGLYFVDNNTGWIAGSKIKKTTDSGLSWVEQINVDPKFFSYIQFVNYSTGWAWYSEPSQEKKIYKTTNGGENWFLQSELPVDNIYFVNELSGWAVVDMSIYCTIDGGDTWDLQYSNPGNFLRYIYFVDQNNGWVVGDNGTILYTPNGGIPVELISFTAEVLENEVELNWSTATEKNNSGFEILRSFKENDWNKIGFVPGHGTTTETQHYSFTDNNVKPGKYQYKLKQIDYDGSFEYSQIVEVEIHFANKFSLSQNYPNPFNPVTKIKYSIPQNVRRETGNVSLKIYDVLGREVATLVNEEKPAGEYEVEFDGTALPSGIYFYQLLVSALQSKDGKAGSFSETRKMVLLR